MILHGAGPRARLQYNGRHDPNLCDASALAIRVSILRVGADAEDFTEEYSTLKLGKVVGEPAAGGDRADSGSV
jgi:hypothetical protein